MTISYGPQVTQVNEKPLWESSLDLTLTQHLRARYYRTLVILLQVNPTSNDEPETTCECFHKIENTSIFA
jgi:hypothetical protein